MFDRVSSGVSSQRPLNDRRVVAYNLPFPSLWDDRMQGRNDTRVPWLFASLSHGGTWKFAIYNFKALH